MARSDWQSSVDENSADRKAAKVSSSSYHKAFWEDPTSSAGRALLSFQELDSCRRFPSCFEKENLSSRGCSSPSWRWCRRSCARSKGPHTLHVPCQCHSGLRVHAGCQLRDHPVEKHSFPSCLHPHQPPMFKVQKEHFWWSALYYTILLTFYKSFIVTGSLRKWACSI